MTNAADQLREAWVTLRQVPFVRGLTVANPEAGGGSATVSLVDSQRQTHQLHALVTDIESRSPGNGAADDASRIDEIRALPARQRSAKALALVLAMRLSPAVVRRLRQGRKSALGTLLVAPYVNRHAGELLRLSGLNYVDARGNLYLELHGGRYVAHVEGRGTRRSRRRRLATLRAAGHRVLFAILANPKLLHATVRELERESGASRQAVSELLGRLRAEGSIVRDGRSRHHFVEGRRDELRERFAKGWVDSLRPTLMVGSFRARDAAVERLQATILQVLGKEDLAWGLGGTAGAMRLAPHYRGADTVLHVADWSERLTRKLGLIPDRNGPVRIYRTMGKLDLTAAADHCAHPLLVYAELATSGDDRGREAAELLRETLSRLTER